jgi:LAO/AO transport system kinase
VKKKHRQDIIDKIKHHKAKLGDVKSIISGILEGDVHALSQGITIVESNSVKDWSVAKEIIEACIPFSGNSIRIGITGVPGVGKSTFIESFGQYLCNEEKKVAVLAIDPSSQRSKGSILGDKTRMEKLSSHKNAFIRPSPSADSSGGVAAKTREAVILCEAAGFDVVLIETVGVGQSELAVHSMVDFFLLLMLAGAGDELQGIKRGIMEMADALMITKADGDNLKNAKKAMLEYKTALHLFPPHPGAWTPQVDVCSAISNEGIERVWKIVESYANSTKINGHFEQKRKEQALYWFRESLNEKIKNHFYKDEHFAQQLRKLEEEVVYQKTSPFVASEVALSMLLKK